MQPVSVKIDTLMSACCEQCA